MTKTYNELTGHRYRGEFRLHRRQLKADLRALKRREKLKQMAWSRPVMRAGHRAAELADGWLPPILYRALCWLVPPAIVRLFR